MTKMLKDAKEHTDFEIIEEVLNGRTDLYEEIIRRYNSTLYKIGRSYKFNHQDTQDLMQDTYINAYYNLSNFKNLSSFKTWLSKIMLHNCYHKTQKASFKNEVVKEIIEEQVPMFNQNKNSKNNTIENNELGLIIESALEKIPFDYRMVFSLREVIGFNVNETSSLLNISESNVKARLSRSKALLRKEIEKIYSPSELYDFNLIYCDLVVKNVMNEIKRGK